MTIRRSFLPLVALLVGCGRQEPIDESSSAFVITELCEVSGAGTLENGDSMSGSVHGDGVTIDGTWEHDGDSVVLGDPAWIVCRINGSAIADFSGPATIDGALGYTFRVQVQDLAVEGVPPEHHGVTTTETLTATRSYSPARWLDGALAIDSHVLVVIPTELDVTIGNGANQWTRLSFARTLYGDTIMCRYRAQAGTAQPTTAEEIAGGQTYVLERCVGEAVGTPAVVGGDAVDLTSMTLHVDNGSPDFPSSDGAQTTVSVDLQVTAFRPLEQDFYRIQVFDNLTGVPVIHSEGFLVSGDLAIHPLVP